MADNKQNVPEVGISASTPSPSSFNMSTLLGPGLGLVGSLIGNSQQASNIRKQLKAQAIEYEKTRKYNLNLAKMQNQWNIDQWNRENEYNLPANQMKRYMDAGLNPDLIYNQSNLASSSPNLTSGAPATPMDMSPISGMPTFSDVISKTLEGSQIGLTSAQTQKEIVGVKQAESTIKLLNHKANTEYQRTQLTHEQWQELQATNKVIQENMNEFASYIKSTWSISESEAKYLADTLVDRVAQQEAIKIKMNHENYILDCQKGYWTIYKENAEHYARGEKEIFDLNLSMLKTNEEWQIFDKIFGMIGSIVSTGTTILSKGKM